MSATESTQDRRIISLDKHITVTEEVECERCDRLNVVEPDTERPDCHDCGDELDDETVRRTASVSTKYIGNKDSLEAVADLYGGRAEAVRELYERGWESNIYIDGPNAVYAIPGDDDQNETREPIDDEKWEGYEATDASAGIGHVNYVSKCPFCDRDILVKADGWDAENEFVDEDEVFCRSCEMSVPKNPVAIEHSLFPKVHFLDTDNLRAAAIRLRTFAGWLRGLKREGWKLESVRSKRLHLRFEIESTDKIVLDNSYHLEEIKR